MTYFISVSMRTVAFLAAALIVAGPMKAGAATNKLLAEFTFDDTSKMIDGKFPGIQYHAECDHSYTVVDGARAGAHAMQFGVAENDIHGTCPKKRFRSEFVLPWSTAGYVWKDQILKWDDGRSYWFGFSVKPVYFPNEAYTFFQIHAPTVADESITGCNLGANAMTMVPKIVDGVLSYAFFALENGGKATKGGATGNAVRVWSAPIMVGTYTDFVVNFTLSAERKGFIRLWRNGTLVYEKSNITNVNYIDTCDRPADRRYSYGPYIGIYGPADFDSISYNIKYFGTDLKRQAAFDEVRLAEGPDAYDLVNPAQRDPKPVPVVVDPAPVPPPAPAPVSADPVVIIAGPAADLVVEAPVVDLYDPVFVSDTPAVKEEPATSGSSGGAATTESSATTDSAAASTTGSSAKAKTTWGLGGAGASSSGSKGRVTGSGSGGGSSGGGGGGGSSGGAARVSGPTSGSAVIMAPRAAILGQVTGSQKEIHPVTGQKVIIQVGSAKQAVQVQKDATKVVAVKDEKEEQAGAEEEDPLADETNAEDIEDANGKDVTPDEIDKDAAE